MKFLPILLLIIFPAAAFAQIPFTAPDIDVEMNSFKVPMADHVALAVDGYFPTIYSRAGGAILTRTPYNKFSLVGSGTVMTQLGIPVFLEDVRGRNASHGTYDLFFESWQDGPQTIKWITSRFDVDLVATHGYSANGIDQYFIAGENPPGLGCQLIATATPNLYNAVFQGGQLRKNLMESWLTLLECPDYLDELIEQEIFGYAYWGNVCLYDDWSSVNVPAIHIAGWYDCFLQGTLEGFCGYHYEGGAGAVGQSKLIIGPWRHGGTQKQVQGQLMYPANSVDDFSYDMFLDLFAYALGVPNNYAGWPAVTYYVMGDVDDPLAPGNEWEYAADWPPAYTEKNWYIKDTGRLEKSLPTGSFQHYTYDPGNPVPTLGGQNLFIPNGPYDQSSVENRADVLKFTSDVLSTPYKAVGPVKVRLYVSSDCPDTDFTAKLTDVYPDGRSMLITDGILRMRNRDGVDQWNFMQQGIIYEIEIDLASTAYVWDQGHRIRLTVSSSNYPRFLNNPNTTDGIMANTTTDTALNFVYMNASKPSCLILPEM
jgi:predicted acyl esterase